MDLDAKILDICKQLEQQQPKTITPKSRQDLMNGWWRMLYTNFAPAAPSSGQLGPLVGDVFQDIDLDSGTGKNILRITFPPICGCLTAKAEFDNTSDKIVKIIFESVGNKLGFLPLGPKINFEPNKEVRLWEHVYIDNTYRILYARREEEKKRSKTRLSAKALAKKP